MCSDQSLRIGLLLIDRGADVLATNRVGRTVACDAIMSRQVNPLRLAIEAGYYLTGEDKQAAKFWRVCGRRWETNQLTWSYHRKALICWTWQRSALKGSLTDCPPAQRSCCGAKMHASSLARRLDVVLTIRSIAPILLHCTCSHTSIIFFLLWYHVIEALCSQDGTALRVDASCVWCVKSGKPPEYCNYAPCESIGKKRCTGCWKRIYCSAACQQNDWKDGVMYIYIPLPLSHSIRTCSSL